MPEREVEARLTRVRGAIRERGLDGLLVYSNMERDGNVAYLTNFRPFDPRMPGLALITPDTLEAVIKVSKRDLAFILTHIWSPAEPSDFLGDEFPGQVAAAIDRAGLRGKRIGLAGRALLPPALEPQIMALFPQGVAEVDGMLEELRRHKSAPERELLRAAGEKAEAVIRDASAFAAAGMSENELAAYADYVARKAGALDVEVLLHAADDKMPSAGEQEQLPFRPASERTLTAREHLAVYIAFQYEGYWAEASDSLYIGGPTPEERAAHDRCVAALSVIPGPSTSLRTGSVEGQPELSIWEHGVGLERDELAGDILAAHVALHSGGARAFHGRTKQFVN
jgi:Xaa-Pro aminopeptidase